MDADVTTQHLIQVVIPIYVNASVEPQFAKTCGAAHHELSLINVLLVKKINVFCSRDSTREKFYNLEFTTHCCDFLKTCILYKYSCIFAVNLSKGSYMQIISLLTLDFN